MMDTDPGIVCFQHCSSKVFCFQLPLRCPVCEVELSTAHFRLLPFRIPYPFVRAVQHPCSIVIKPTCGDFLHDYLNSMDLHIGLTTSEGTVIEFDKVGLRDNNTSSWNQCLVLEGAAGPWREHWDSTLQAVAQLGCWTAHRYNEESYNCYTFVLTFLQKLQYGKLSKAAVNKTTFCENFIVPRTTAAEMNHRLLSKVLHVVNSDTGLPNFSRSTLHRLLIDIGLKFQKRGRKSVKVDREDIVMWRLKYLRQIKSFHRNPIKVPAFQLVPLAGTNLVLTLEADFNDLLVHVIKSLKDLVVRRL